MSRLSRTGCGGSADRRAAWISRVSSPAGPGRANCACKPTRVRRSGMATTPLEQLAEHGQSVWIDFLSREFVEKGDLEGLIDQGVRGVTSNPTIFQSAIADGDDYDEQLREILQDETEPKEVFLRLAVRDIQGACDLFKPVHEDESETRDGWVSLEVDPNLAHDTQGTIEEAKRLRDLVDRPNLFVKIPATKEWLPAIEESIANGIQINVTLIF